MIRQLYSDVLFFISTRKKWVLTPLRIIPGKAGKLVKEILKSTYPTMLDWFLRAGSSKKESGFISPVQGKILQTGKIIEKQIVYSPNKNIKCNIENLIHSESDYKYFSNIYLSPFDYHYFIAPTDMKVINVRHIQGKLLSVSERTQNKKKNLMIENERYVIECECKLGRFKMIPVGAVGVSSIYLKCSRNSIETISKKSLLFSKLKKKKAIEFEQKITGNTLEKQEFSKGQPFGFFMFGSTMIILSDFELNKLGSVELGDSLQ